MQNSDKKSKKEKRGLYFALAVCLLAVGIAAWGTYNSVSNYVKTREGDNGSIIRENEDPEKPQAGRAEATPAPENPSTENSSPTESVGAKPETPVNNDEVSETPSQNEAESKEENGADNEAVDAPLYSLKEKFIYPVAGREIKGEFSGSELVYSETMKDYRAHSGTDINSELGETVFASNNGVVKKAYKDLLLGNVIIIEHGDYNLWYCGLGETFLVKEGDVVTAAKAIGSVKEVPYEAAAAHLHLQVEKDGVFVDPMDLPFEE